MKRLLSILSCFAFVALLIESCRNRSAIHYNVGLKVFKDFDSTRRFDTTNGPGGMFYRPVKIDVFYPSEETVTGPPLNYGDIIDMYEQRMNYENSMDSCRKVSLMLGKIFADYFKVDSVAKLLNYKTQIFNDLELPDKRFPLIIYASGMNGSSWENPALFDTLVRHGYIVAAISSVGKFPGYMASAIDLEEQVDDILCTIQKMKKEKYIDKDKIGLLGWSLGGTAVAKAAMLSKDIQCLLSYDGTEIHYFGFDTAWDAEYKKIMRIPPYKPEDLTVPYMYLSSEHPKQIDSVYVFPNHIGSNDKYFLEFTHAVHENFSFLPTLAKGIDPNLANIDSGRHQAICKLTLTFFDEYLKHFVSASTKDYITQLIANRPGFVNADLPRN